MLGMAGCSANNKPEKKKVYSEEKSDDKLNEKAMALAGRVYEEAAKNAQNAQGAESSNNDQAEDVTNAEFVDKN